LRPLRVARGLEWCDHDYPRWGEHTSSPGKHTGTTPVLGAPASLIGSELSSLLGSGLYTVLGRVVSAHPPTTRPSLYPFVRCAGPRVMRTCLPPVGRAQHPCTADNRATVLSVLVAPAFIIGSELPRARLRPFALPRPDAAGVVLCTPGPRACRFCT